MTIESEDDHVRLESYARGEGRGRAVVVHVTVEGDLRGPVDFGFLAPFANSLHVTGIVYAEPVSDDAFMAVVEATRACASQSG